MDRFFFFGTLMDADILAAVLDRPVQPEDLHPARLDGFARRRVANDSFPMLVEAPSGAVDGVVFTATGSEDRDRILFFEDFDYDLEPCRPVLADGSAVEAVFCGAEEKTLAADDPWELESWAARHKSAFLEVTRVYMVAYGRMTPEEAEAVWQDARRRLQPEIV